MSIHLRTFAAGCLFTLVVFAASSLAASSQGTPKPLHAIGTAVISVNGKTRVLGTPSDHDRLLALIKRTDRLQNQQADTRSIALEADAAAGEAQSMTQCIGTLGVALIERSDGSIVTVHAGHLDDDRDAFVIPTIDDSCVAS